MTTIAGRQIQGRSGFIGIMGKRSADASRDSENIEGNCSAKI
jgi:hypothetical protein